MDNLIELELRGRIASAEQELKTGWQENQKLAEKLAISEAKRRNQRKQLRSYQKLWSMYVKGTHDGMFKPEPDQTS